MQTEQILTSDVLDILFYNKNKMYGAYALRKFYPTRIKKALLIMIGFTTLLSIISLIPQKNKPAIPTVETVLTSIKLQLEQAKSEVPKKLINSTVKQINQQKFLQNIVMVQKVDSADQLNDISNFRIGNISNVHAGTEMFIEDFTSTSNNENGQMQVVSSTKELAKQFPIDDPDVQPTYPGGAKALIRFLEQNLQVPPSVELQQTVGVKVKFVVDFDGDLQSFTVVEDGGEPFNTEVVRVLKKMPKWIPGKKGQQNVPVFFTIPVKFKADQ